MRLVLLEYLRMLRESGEFDVLLPDLLLAMNIVPISKPQIGVRQAGVDLAAVGPDENGMTTLWIFVLKRNDLGRRDWDTGQQAVRQSLDEIKDTYLRNNIAPEHKDLPVRIVVATTGDFKQDFEQQRAGYSATNTLTGRTYAFWNGDRVAALIEEHLLNEYALPTSARSELRRALALVGEPDYELAHFFAMLKLLLAWDADGDEAMKSEKNCLRDLHTISLALGILCRWAAQDGNLKNAVIASERTLLWAWDAMRRRGFTQNQTMVHGYIRIASIYLNTTVEYFNKVQSHLHTRDAFARYHRESALLTERVFEEVGLLATIGLVHFLWGVTVKDDEGVAGAMAVADSFAEFLQSHKITGSPCYDGQSVDIALALTFLFLTKQIDPLKVWLRELTRRLTFGYRKGQWFPISTDSFDDLVDLELGDGDIAKLTETSWMVPMLAEWLAVMEEDETYLQLVKLKGDLKETSFQVWYPDERTAEFLYARPALDTGVTEAPIDLPATAEEMRARMRKIQTESPVKSPFESSAAKAGIGWLDFVASRHFRTPRDPAFWQRMALAPLPTPTAPQDSGESPSRPEEKVGGADDRGVGT